MLTNWCYSNKHVDVTAGSKPPSFYHIQKVETTYAFVYTYIFPKRTCWVHIMLLVCMPLGLTVWRWAISWCAEDHLSHSQLSAVACSSQASPHAVWHAHWCPPCLPRVWAVIVVRSYGCSFWCDRRHSLIANSDPPALTVFPPLFCNVPRATGAAVFYRCSHLSQQWKS